MEPIVIAFIAGILTKLADSLKPPYDNMFGALYGILNGILGFYAFPVVLGTTIGVYLAKKVDKTAHRIGTAILLFISVFAPKEYLLTLPFIVMASYLDEKLPIRVVLPFTVLMLSPFVGWNYILLLLSWDVGYNLTSYILSLPPSQSK